MPTFQVTQKMTTYATAEVEADTLEDLYAKVLHDDAGGDVDWSYETDFDSATTTNIKQI